MTKVITYGTYDLLHYGHIRLLERAKALGDYLIVGVTADDFDKTRGKINVQQSLMERVLAVKKTGLADEIIIEEYEGQKIDDILRYNVDIFTVGSDWKGKFDYLNEYCKVVYLDRTQGVSSTELRSQKRLVKMGLVGDTGIFEKYRQEAAFANGVEVAAAYTEDVSLKQRDNDIVFTNDYDKLLEIVDAVFIVSHPSKHYEQIKKALLRGKHVLCESPIALKKSECQELFEIAEKNDLILMDAIKTAYATAYHRLLLLAKSGKIGNIVSVDATCTSTKEMETQTSTYERRNSICAWGPTALLPVFQLLGTDYEKKEASSYFMPGNDNFDLFTKINFNFKNAVASVKVGKGVKAEGNLIIAGTKGYIYVPAPWWKTDYFEIRYENQEENKRYFYQLDGEGIRYQIVAFIRSIESKQSNSYISQELSEKICSVIEEWNEKKDLHTITV
ncbi:Gfo/Idh/MocA family oxidoreductase [uncultured Eubacterium sp.]|uniref:Gfo/Idh/MocA family oxidoreductase n=1 Tax=uncultured Eubacterium sp. TaxID=165185 RepID=UPI0025FFD9CB|nr:Gfo/Idh/MocA family oxidoreductase [uncultured Eubacterium sp.]